MTTRSTKATSLPAPRPVSLPAPLPAREILQARFLLAMRMRNCTARTIEQWTATLTRFNAWCSDRGIESVSEVTPDVLAAYRRHLFHYRNPKTHRPLKYSTQVSYLVSVRRWFHWLAKERLFVSCQGRRFCRTNVSALVRGYLDKSGMTMRGSCHLLRHTAATLMLTHGADLRSLQLYLGHEHLNTTQIYTHVSIDRLKEVHARTHPARPDGPPPVA